ncbi:MAG TPA: thioredoxin domain-containing protein [Actinocrinis sp.]|jgi:protein-disulfide isomerase|uniref:DsbA family protein n=1 Tax=Actinocrinis sp. TaxID=1920516 RepID=UPI002D666AA8|nr:thioredoxin domain-containing protein [Actinocrinis sp.]HZU54421.1 thioredoxin domain-containing protein [Actinocrinis sp.]
MSKANRVGKELARQRAAELRLEQQRRARRNRLYAIYGSVVAVIAVAVGIAFAVQAANAPKTPTAVPVGAVADTTGGVSAADGMAIPLGNADAKVKLTVYEDARCSACKSYETTYTPAYKKLIQDGTLELLIHPVTLIDANTNGSGSLHAGNAFACAQDAGHFEDYHDIIYTNQPAETTDSFASDATLIALAKQVQGLDTKTFESCVNSHKYFDWVRQNYADLNKVTNNQPSTPTIYANGKAYTLPTASTTEAAQAAFIASIDKLAGVNPSASPSASASGSAAASTSPSAAASPSPSASKS